MSVPAPHMTGPPAGHTGGFGEPTCVTCHIGNEVNAFGGTVRLVGLPDAYDPGASYVLTIVLRAEETAAAGFQMAARFEEGPRRGEPAGTLVSLGERVRLTTAETGQRYLNHTEVGARTMDPSGSSWTVKWVAPDAGGPVAIHLAANSANGDNSPLADLIFTHAVSIAATPR